MEKIKVLIVDDQNIFRESLRFMLEQDREIKVTGSLEDGLEAFEFCKKEKPDLVLMDVLMPRCDGVEGTRMIKEEFSEIKIIILTTMLDDENIAGALKYGADGYILKDISPEQLIQAIKNVHQGLSIMHRDVMKTMAQRIDRGEQKKVEPDSRVELLTPREIEVVKLVGQGKNYAEISGELAISEGRARNIVSSVLIKLELKDRVKLAVFAVKNGLI